MGPRSLATDAAALAATAYGLALRITRDEARAAESVETALERRRLPLTEPAAFLGAVREQARARREDDPDPATAPRPRRLGVVAHEDWAVLERVALRGMSATEVAGALGISRPEVLLRLRRGLVAAGSGLLGERQAGHEARAAR